MAELIDGKYLVIDGSKGGIFALLKSGDFIETLEYSNKISTMKALPDIIDKILDKADIQLSDLDFIAVCVGPGSFTTNRLIVTAANALASTTKKPLIAYNAFELLAPIHTNATLVYKANKNSNYYAIIKNGQICEMSECSDELLLNLDNKVFIDTNEFSDEELYQLINLVQFKYSKAMFNYCVEPLYLKKCQAERDLENRLG